MRWLRPISFMAPVGLAIALSSASSGQITNIRQTSFAATDTSVVSEFVAFGDSPRLSPQLALAAYERGLREQSNQLTGYTAVTVIDAELPDSAQKAEFELKRHYAAPALLEFTPMRSSGDNFVKSNVIIRLLQSEVDHVRHREQSQTAVNSQNYKFNYKGMAQLNGVAAHVFDVKPRHKRVGLFKGRIYVDASSGRLLRAQGRIVKSPSFFIKKIDFVQEYATINGFTLPTHIHSEAQTRLVGKAIVDVIQRDYQPEIGRADASVQTAVVMGGTD